MNSVDASFFQQLWTVVAAVISMLVGLSFLIARLDLAKKSQIVDINAKLEKEIKSLKDEEIKQLKEDIKLINNSFKEYTTLKEHEVLRNVVRDLNNKLERGHELSQQIKEVVIKLSSEMEGMRVIQKEIRESILNRN